MKSLTVKIGTYKKTFVLSTEEQLIHAAHTGDEAHVTRILEENKELVNWKDHDGWTALHWACRGGHGNIVTMLLAHPDIDANPKDNAGWTPFLVACFEGKLACVRPLLWDARVIANEPNNTGYTPLRCAAEKGHIEVIAWWIASGRDMDTGQPGNLENDAIGGAKEHGDPLGPMMLEVFKVQPEALRERMRTELGCFDELAAERFALVVFLSDGLLQRRMGEMEETEFSRFFAMALRLPIELQMILCHRVVGSTGELIPLKQREKAFKELASRYRPEETED